MKTAKVFPLESFAIYSIFTMHMHINITSVDLKQPSATQPSLVSQPTQPPPPPPTSQKLKVFTNYT